MKKLLLVLFTLISLNVCAQSDRFKVKEDSFHKIDGCITIPERYDDNDAAMAVVKIIPENINEQERVKLYFAGNLATFIEVEQHIGETWVYLTAEAATFLKIQHPDYGSTEFWFPMDLKPRQCYEMVLQYTGNEPEYGIIAVSSDPNEADVYIDGKHYGKTTAVITDLNVGTHLMKIEKQGYVTITKNIEIKKGETLKLDEKMQTVRSQMTYLIIKADQPDALIYIDGEPVNTGEASMSVNIGTTHTYKIQCNLYHEESGSVTVNERKTIEKTLRPNFGYINVSTTPEQGAKVFINGEYIGLSPIKTDKLASGTHTVRVMRDMYKMKEQSFTVTDGQTTSANINMAANFVNVTVSTDANSDIYVDDEYKAKGKWNGRLSDGFHSFEARKESHRATKKSLELVMGKTETITLEAPKPISGTLDVNSSPMGAAIYVDGKHYGETPNYVSDILIGTHTLKLEKQGCAPITKTITIKENETLTINEKLQTGKTVSKTINVMQNGGDNNVKLAFNQEINGHEYVDLGLSVKWATCNVGASSPEDYGNYYAWGETNVKSSYETSNCSTYEKRMNDIKGNSQYDVARKNWGGAWRMPTCDELNELRNNCTWTWTTQNGVNGYKVTGTNGNSIFLPAAGDRYGSSLLNAGSEGEYLSSAPGESKSYGAYYLSFDSSDHSMDLGNRGSGRSVRPVLE